MTSPQMTTHSVHFRQKPDWPGTLGWMAAAAVVLFGVLAINGVPLFYHDTAGYFGHGEGIFRVLGVFQPDATPGTGTGTATDPTNGDGIVIGSRSAIYAVFVAFLTRMGPVWTTVVAQTALLWGSVWLTAHFALRLAPRGISATRLSAMGLVAAGLGSAGFYVAYLMPDIFAPLLLLAMAGLVGFAPVLGFWGALALLAMGGLAVVMHPSHLAIALVMLLPCFLLGYLFQTGHLLRTMLLLALIPAAGIGERFVFDFAVERSSGGNNQVVYLPFFTARLISDGPGRAFLAEHCPSDVWATCDLYARLQSPEQLSPDIILFSTGADTGSFALLTPEQKRDIAFEQSSFLRAVALSRPFSVAVAALGNTLEQLSLVSPRMTVPDTTTVIAVHRVYDNIPPELDTGRLIADNPGWMPLLTQIHQVYYILAAAVATALIVLPMSRVHINIRVFGLLIFAGLLANAFVTGAISQPADRYGARVIFLVPLLATLLAMLRAPATRSSEGKV